MRDLTISERFSRVMNKDPRPCHKPGERSPQTGGGAAGWCSIGGLLAARLAVYGRASPFPYTAEAPCACFAGAVFARCSCGFAPVQIRSDILALDRAASFLLNLDGPLPVYPIPGEPLRHAGLGYADQITKRFLR